MSSLKKMSSSRALKVGHFLAEFATPGIGHILKSAGCDFVILDMEHSGFSYETVRQVVQYCRAASLPLIVRVPSSDYHDISRALDMGADGVMLPMVGTADEARAIVHHVRYPPKGGRGAIFGFAHDNYASGTPLAKTRAANRSLMIIVQIETVDGLNNVDAIAEVEGVDCLWVGHFDLSNALGIPGEFDHPQFLDANRAVIRAARRHQKSAGRLVATIEESIDLYGDGFDFISYSGDVWVLQNAVRAGINDIRAGCAKLSASRTTQAAKTVKSGRSNKTTAKARSRRT